jgi:hypothetical protein
MPIDWKPETEEDKSEAKKLAGTAIRFVKANGDKGSGAEELVTRNALREIEAEVSLALLLLRWENDTHTFGSQAKRAFTRLDKETCVHLVRSIAAPHIGYDTKHSSSFFAERSTTSE